MYGYLRGCNMKRGARVHLAGVGDYTVRCGAHIAVAGSFKRAYRGFVRR